MSFLFEVSGNNEKTKHKEVHEFIYEKAKIKAKTEIFKITEIDNFINFLNSYSSNSTIILATSKDIGKPGPLIDKLIYEKGNSLHCPLVIINGNLEETAAPGLVQTTSAHSIGKHDSNSSAFDGHIEEFMIYKTKLVPVDKESEYVLNTADYLDKIGNDLASNSAKLFAFDYTNIRGKNDNEVASSKNITWRVDAP